MARLSIPPRRLLAALVLAFAISGGTGTASGAVPPGVRDPLLEERVDRIASVLRCLVCQNQTIADSHAELAVDLKNQIREQLARGGSEQTVIDYMVARYGDFVLYRPPLRAHTIPLWFGPAGLAFAALLIVVLVIRRRAAGDAAMPVLDESQRQAVERLVAPAADPGNRR